MFPSGVLFRNFKAVNLLSFPSEINERTGWDVNSLQSSEVFESRLQTSCELMFTQSGYCRKMDSKRQFCEGQGSNQSL